MDFIPICHICIRACLLKDLFHSILTTVFGLDVKVVNLELCISLPPSFFCDGAVRDTHLLYTSANLRKIWWEGSYAGEKVKCRLVWNSREYDSNVNPCTWPVSELTTDFMPVLVICKLLSKVKELYCWPDQILPFLTFKGTILLINSWMWPVFERFPELMSTIITCMFHDDLITTEWSMLLASLLKSRLKNQADITSLWKKKIKIKKLDQASF